MISQDHFSVMINGILAMVESVWAAFLLPDGPTAEAEVVSFSLRGPPCNMELHLWMLSRMCSIHKSLSKSAYIKQTIKSQKCPFAVMVVVCKNHMCMACLPQSAACAPFCFLSAASGEL